MNDTMTLGDVEIPSVPAVLMVDNDDDRNALAGSVFGNYTIATNPPPPAGNSSLYASAQVVLGSNDHDDVNNLVPFAQAVPLDSTVSKHHPHPHSPSTGVTAAATAADGSCNNVVAYPDALHIAPALHHDMNTNTHGVVSSTLTPGFATVVTVVDVEDGENELDSSTPSPQFAYGLSDAHYEDAWSKKWRRRKRRRARMVIGGMTGFVAGTFLLGPLGGLAGAATGAVMSRTVSKVGERRKDRRLARERTTVQQYEQAQGGNGSGGDGSDGQRRRAVSEEASLVTSDQALITPQSPSFSSTSGTSSDRTFNNHHHRSTDDDDDDDDVVGHNHRMPPRGNSYDYCEYDDLALPPPRDSCHGYESPRQERRRRREERRNERRSQRGAR